MDKEKKNGGKFRKIAGGMVSLLVIIILFKACTGSFNEEASDITNGAYGSGVQKTTATVKETENLPKELSSYLSYTEEELLKELEVEKNDMGYYPNDSEVNFICMDGKVYSVIINQSHKKDGEYMIFGITLGKDSGKVGEKLGEDFELLDSSDAVGGKRDTYINKETGHLLTIDYDSKSVITGVSCVLESDTKTEPETEPQTNSTETKEETVILEETDSELERIISWLTSIGAYDHMKDFTKDEVINQYYSIQNDLDSWGIPFEEMRYYLEEFHRGLTLDEIEQLTDYEVYLEFIDIKGYENFVAEDYIYEPSDFQEFKDYLRDSANIGTKVKFPGKVMYTISYDDKYNYLILVETGFGVYISEPEVNLFDNDEITITAVYQGKNDRDMICFDTISVEFQ